MTRLLNTLSKGQILDLIASEEDVPLYDRRMGTTTDAGELYLASKTLPIDHHNKIAQDGLDRCECGSKYWEWDRCIDCQAQIVGRQRNGEPIFRGGAE